MSLKFGILRESTKLKDRRAPFSPKMVKQLMTLYPNAHFEVESSSNRIFSDDEYKYYGIEIVSNSTDCDVFIGINPIITANLIPNKNYLIVTDLLHAITPLFTFDTLISLVGTYNAFRAFGIKFELFKLPAVSTFSDQTSLISYLKRTVLPPLKITIIGSDNQLLGSDLVMKAIKIKKVIASDFLSKNYAQSVYTVVDGVDSEALIALTKVSDIFIVVSRFGNQEVIVSQEMLKAKDCKLRVVADLTPSSNNLISCVVRDSTFEEPFYGYLPIENKEVDIFHPAAIVVVAIPDVTTEFPGETSEFIGNQLAKHYIPSFFK